MNYDRPSADLCTWVSVSRAIRADNLVVIGNDILIIHVPDLDPEQVTLEIIVVLKIAINSREQEAVVAHTVDRTAAFILRLSTGNYQPVVCVRVEDQITNRDGCCLLIDNCSLPANVLY